MSKTTCNSCGWYVESDDPNEHGIGFDCAAAKKLQSEKTLNETVYIIIKNILKMRHEVIAAGGRPTTIKVSQLAIDRIRLFGMNIEIVDASDMPDNVDMIVMDKEVRPSHD